MLVDICEGDIRVCNHRRSGRPQQLVTARRAPSVSGERDDEDVFVERAVEWTTLSPCVKFARVYPPTGGLIIIAVALDALK